MEQKNEQERESEAYKAEPKGYLQIDFRQMKEPEKSINYFALGGMILGIIGCLFLFFLKLWEGGLIAGIITILLSSMGLYFRKGKWLNGCAVAGLTMGIVASFFSIVILILE